VRPQTVVDFHKCTLATAKVFLMKYIKEKVVRQVNVSKGNYSINESVLKEEITMFLKSTEYTALVSVIEDTKKNGFLNLTYIE